MAYSDSENGIPTGGEGDKKVPEGAIVMDGKKLNEGDSISPLAGDPFNGGDALSNGKSKPNKNALYSMEGQGSANIDSHFLKPDTIEAGVPNYGDAIGTMRPTKPSAINEAKAEEIKALESELIEKLSKNKNKDFLAFYGLKRKNYGLKRKNQKKLEQSIRNDLDMAREQAKAAQNDYASFLELALGSGSAKAFINFIEKVRIIQEKQEAETEELSTLAFARKAHFSMRNTSDEDERKALQNTIDGLNETLEKEAQKLEESIADQKALIARLETERNKTVLENEKWNLRDLEWELEQRSWAMDGFPPLEEEPEAEAKAVANQTAKPIINDIDADEEQSKPHKYVPFGADDAHDQSQAKTVPASPTEEEDKFYAPVPTQPTTDPEELKKKKGVSLNGFAKVAKGTANALFAANIVALALSGGAAAIPAIGVALAIKFGPTLALKAMPDGLKAKIPASNFLKKPSVQFGLSVAGLAASVAIGLMSGNYERILDMFGQGAESAVPTNLTTPETGASVSPSSIDSPVNADPLDPAVDTEPSVTEIAPAEVEPAAGAVEEPSVSEAGGTAQQPTLNSGDAAAKASTITGPFTETSSPQAQVVINSLSVENLSYTDIVEAREAAGQLLIDGDKQGALDVLQTAMHQATADGQGGLANAIDVDRALISGDRIGLEEAYRTAVDNGFDQNEAYALEQWQRVYGAADTTPKLR